MGSHAVRGPPVWHAYYTQQIHCTVVTKWLPYFTNSRSWSAVLKSGQSGKFHLSSLEQQIKKLLVIWLCLMRVKRKTHSISLSQSVFVMPRPSQRSCQQIVGRKYQFEKKRDFASWNIIPLSLDRGLVRFFPTTTFYLHQCFSIDMPYIFEGVPHSLSKA